MLITFISGLPSWFCLLFCSLVLHSHQSLRRLLCLASPPPPQLTVSPAAAEANFPELTLADFFKPPDAFSVYLLILMIYYFVLLHDCRRRVEQKPKLKLSRESCATMRSCRCMICLEDYVAGDVVRVWPPCGNEFHAFCIDKWFSVRLYLPFLPHHPSRTQHTILFITHFYIC